MRSAMRTVEKRCEMNSAILPVGEFGETFKDFVFAARVKRGGRFVKNEQL